MNTIKTKKQVIIVAGPNGSGKTTLSKEILNKSKFFLLNADSIAEKLDPNDFENVQMQAGRLFFKTLYANIKKNKSFAIESTLSGSYLIKIIKELKKKKYFVTIVYVFLDNPETAIKRIKIRVEKGGHYISDEDVVRRFYRSKNNFCKKYKKIVDDWQLLYNGEEGLESVAVGSKEKFEIFDDKKFELFKKE